MGIFTGGSSGEIITPTFISPSVVAVGAPLPSDANDTINGGGGADTIDGGRGSDLMSGGGGADTFVWDPGDGSDTIDGGAGSDTLLFNGSNANEKIMLAGDADGHLILSRDVANITMDVDNTEHVAINTLGGTDLVTVGDLGGTDVKTVDIDLNANGVGDTLVDTVALSGGAGDDHLSLTSAGGVTTVNGLSVTVNVTTVEATDQIALAGGEGDDTLDASAFAGGITVNFDGGGGNDLLSFKGTGSGDTIAFEGSPGPNGDGVGVSINGGPAENFNVLNVETVSLDAGAGDDTIGASSLSRALNIEGGAGNDLIIGSRGADTIDGGSGSDTIDGGGGGDLVQGGGGADTLIWNPGGGSDTVDGGGGQDTLQFDGSNANEKIVLSGDADGHLILTRDVANITMDVDNTEHVAINTLGGTDLVTVGDLGGTDVKTVDIDLNANGVGDTLVDTVQVVGRAQGDHLVVTGSAGSATVTGLPETVNVTSVETTDQLAVSGSGGNDTVDASAFGGGLGLTLAGGDGADRFVFASGVNAQDQILDFQLHGANPQGDVLALHGFADHSLADLIANSHIAQSGADVVITEDTLAITLKNITLSALTANDFLFA